MLILPYRLEELQFAFCNRIFIRTHTYRRRPVPSLAHLSFDELKIALETYNLHLLELTSSTEEVQAMLSLQPTESTSSAISKTKGRICKWLSSKVAPIEHSNSKTLGRGYFAVTVGASLTSEKPKYPPGKPGGIEDLPPKSSSLKSYSNSSTTVVLNLEKFAARPASSAATTAPCVLSS